MIKSSREFTDKDYRYLSKSLEIYFLERYNRISRFRKFDSGQGDMKYPIIARLRAKMFAKECVEEVKAGKRFCVANLQVSGTLGFMVGKVSKKKVALLMNWFIDGADMTDGSRRISLELEKRFLSECERLGAVRVLAVSNERDNLFVNALETLDFEEVGWKRGNVYYGKRMSLNGSKKC